MATSIAQNAQTGGVGAGKPAGFNPETVPGNVSRALKVASAIAERVGKARIAILLKVSAKTVSALGNLFLSTKGPAEQFGTVTGGIIGGAIGTGLGARGGWAGVLVGGLLGTYGGGKLGGYLLKPMDVPYAGTAE